MFVMAQLFGALCVVAGVAWVCPPAALVILGVAMLVIGWRGER